MGVVLTGIVLAVAIAVGAGFFLRGEQREAWQVYNSGSSVRIGDPGENLVGQNWSGNPSESGAGEGEETPAS